MAAPGHPARPAVVVPPAAAGYAGDEPSAFAVNDLGDMAGFYADERRTLRDGVDREVASSIQPPGPSGRGLGSKDGAGDRPSDGRSSASGCAARTCALSGRICASAT